MTDVGLDPHDNYTLHRHTDRFIAIVANDGTTDVDPDKVAITTVRHPPPKNDPGWVAPTDGIADGVARKGIMTGTMTPGIRHYLWALPPDPDEHQPKLAATVWLE